MNFSAKAQLSCPFVPSGKIEDAARFVGRKDELRILADRMSGSQPVSVNIVGERLSGKSSLLQHFVQTYEQRIDQPSHFLVVYLCLRLVKPKTEADFYQSLAAALSKLSAIEKLMPLRTALAKFSGGGRAFAAILELLAEHNLLPVFCLDEFEKLLDCKDELKKDFYDGLHSLINSNRMMLIIATRKPVESIAAEKQLQSAFFNFGHLCTLGDFPDEEAEELLLLPSRLAPALDEDDRRLARKWGGSTPHRLQLAAFCLFEARRLGKSTAWAKEQFKKQPDQTKQRGIWTSPLELVLRDCRSQLGWMAEDSEKCRKVLLNIVLPLAGLIVLACALLTGKVQLSAALDWLLKKIGLL